MKDVIPDRKKIAPFLLFYILSTMQVGVGILGYQNFVSQFAGYDAWISVILSGLFIMGILYLIFKMLEIADGDLLDIHTYIFGRKLSKILTSIFILYYCLIVITIIRNYIEMVQVWMFPIIQVFWLALTILIMCIYIVKSGFRTIVGICFFSFLLPFVIAPVFLFTLPYADFSNMLPIMDHSIVDIIRGVKGMMFTITGFEMILFFYPFIKDPRTSRKWGYFSILATIILYLYLIVLTFAYFPPDQLVKNIWPTLTMWQIIQFPFIERFEYIGIAAWLLIILPNVCLSLWIASRLCKRIFKVSQKGSLYFIVLVCLVATSFLLTREQVTFVTDIAGQMSFYFIFVYIPFLFIATLIAKKVRNHGKGS